MVANTELCPDAVRHSMSTIDKPLDAVMPVLYDRLRAIAAHHMRGEAACHSLRATALAHEAVIRLLRAASQDWNDTEHILSTASRIMRHLLIDHARSKARRSANAHVIIDDAVSTLERKAGPLQDLENALERLAIWNADGVRLVELRFYLGLTVAETARVMGRPKRTIEREWQEVRAWLYAEMRDD